MKQINNSQNTELKVFIETSQMLFSNFCYASTNRNVNNKSANQKPSQKIGKESAFCF